MLVQDVKVVCQLDAQNYFVGLTTADKYGDELLVPGGAIVTSEPKQVANKRAKWDGKNWVYEDVPKPVLIEKQPEPEPLPSPKEVGVEFRGVMCSATGEDQSGLVAVFMDYQMEGDLYEPTNFRFANGSSLILTKENIPAFISTWKPFRKSFFKAEE